MKCHSNKSPGTPVAWLSEEGTAFQIKKCFKRLLQKKLAVLHLQLTVCPCGPQ